MTGADVGGGRAAGLRSSSAGRDFPRQAAEAEVFALGEKGELGRAEEGGGGRWGARPQTGVLVVFCTLLSQVTNNSALGGQTHIKSISQMTPEVARGRGN